MPYYLVHAGNSLQKIDTAGAVANITLPPGVTISGDRRARFALLNQTILIGNAPSRTLLFDGGSETHLAALVPPTPAAGVANTGAGALTGDYFMAYTFAVKDASGNIISESDLSPISNIQTLAAQGLAISGLALSTDTTVTSRRIYRSASGGDALYWAADIDDNLTTIYLSAEADAALGTEAVTNLGLGAAPGATDADRLKLVVTWKDRVWGVSDIEPDNLRFSGSRMPYAWDALNMIAVPPKGEDSIGVNGFLPRRDELGILKLGRLCKMVGSTPDDFQLIVVQEGVGSYAPDSCVVIRDVGYFLSHDGVYAWGPEGLYSITDALVRPWFTTDDWFNRAAFSLSVGRYNWRTHSYELHLPSVGQTNLNLWVQYDIDRKRWFGPHRTFAFMPTSGGQITNDDGLPVVTVGSASGQLWTQDNDGHMDGDYEIAFDVVTQPYAENAPDLHKLFHEVSVINRNQGGGYVRAQFYLDNEMQAFVLCPMHRDRTRLRRIGNGRLVSVEFIHDTMYEDCEIHGFEVPFTITGRR